MLCLRSSYSLSIGWNSNLFCFPVFTGQPVTQSSHPPVQVGAVWKQPLPEPCGSNWRGLKQPLYQWSSSESAASSHFWSCWETGTAITDPTYTRFFHTALLLCMCGVYETDTMICNYQGLFCNKRMFTCYKVFCHLPKKLLISCEN